MAQVDQVAKNLLKGVPPGSKTVQHKQKTRQKQKQAAPAYKSKDAFAYIMQQQTAPAKQRSPRKKKSPGDVMLDALLPQSSRKRKAKGSVNDATKGLERKKPLSIRRTQELVQEAQRCVLNLAGDLTTAKTIIPKMFSAPAMQSLLPKEIQAAAKGTTSVKVYVANNVIKQYKALKDLGPKSTKRQRVVKSTVVRVAVGSTAAKDGMVKQTHAQRGSRSKKQKLIIFM